MAHHIQSFLSDGRGQSGFVVGRFSELTSEKLRGGALGAVRGHDGDDGVEAAVAALETGAVLHAVDMLAEGA
jgi:hypothetical protein